MQLETIICIARRLAASTILIEDLCELSPSFPDAKIDLRDAAYASLHAQAYREVNALDRADQDVLFPIMLEMRAEIAQRRAAGARRAYMLRYPPNKFVAIKRHCAKLHVDNLVETDALIAAAQ